MAWRWAVALVLLVACGSPAEAPDLLPVDSVELDARGLAVFREVEECVAPQLGLSEISVEPPRETFVAPTLCTAFRLRCCIEDDTSNVAGRYLAGGVLKLPDQQKIDRACRPYFAERHEMVHHLLFELTGDSDQNHSRAGLWARCEH